MKKKIFEVNEISSSTKKSFIIRTITAISMALVLIPAVVIGDLFFVVPIVLVSFVAFYEYINVLSTKKYPRFIDIFTFLMTIILTYWVWAKQGLTSTLLNGDGHIITNDISISTLALATMMLLLFLFSMMYTKFDVTDVCYLLTMALLISLGFQSLFFLRFSPMSSLSGFYDYNGHHMQSSLLLFYVAIGSFASDIGAYGTGILFGKHKMNPRISPKKTWEGFVGGVVLSFVVSFAYAMILDANGIPLLKGILDHDHWYWVLFLSLTMPVVSVIGDFIFSTIKRHYEIKDFSNILPGHGGILDRIDSVLVTSLYVTLILITISYFPFVTI